MDNRSIEETCHSFSDLGYECLAISALTGEGLEELKQLLKDKFPLLNKMPKVS